MALNTCPNIKIILINKKVIEKRKRKSQNAKKNPLRSVNYSIVNYYLGERIRGIRNNINKIED